MVKICKFCGKEFEVTPGQVKARKCEYCSIQCRNKGIKKGKGYKWKHLIFICQECGKEFKTHHDNQKFCSRECVINNIPKREIWGQEKNRIKCICQKCGKEFERKPSRIKIGAGIYCSRECTDKSKFKTIGGEKNCNYGKGLQPGKRNYRNDLGMFFRSKWEANYARLLNWKKISWKYEPKAFPMIIGNKKTTYIPDFYQIELNIWIEVKGYMTDLASKKIEMFKILYPDEKIILLDQKAYYDLDYKYRDIIPNWECDKYKRKK